MVEKVKNWIVAGVGWLHQERDARPLAFFRMVFFSIMLLEVIGFEELMPLLVDEIPFESPSDWRYDFLFLAWKVVLLAVVFGAPSRAWRVVNWVFAVGFFNSVSLYEYHMFYTWTGVSFLSMFTQLNKAWSLERLWVNVKRARSGGASMPMLATNYDTYVILLVGVGFVYADSVLWKFTDPAWVGGLGMYRPASLPFISYDSWLTDGKDSEWVFRSLGFLTLVFEVSFIFAIKSMMRRKGLALVAMAVGIGLHGGIAILFPLPLFGWGYAAFFLLLTPVKWFQFKWPWSRLFVFYYDRECPLCCQTKAVLASLDWFDLVSFEPVQHLSENQMKAWGTTRELMLQDIGGRWSKGNALTFGVETYERVLLLLPFLMPIGFLLWIPGVRSIARQVYGQIAQRRLVNRCTFDSCGVPLLSSGNLDLIAGLSLKRVRSSLLVVLLAAMCSAQMFISHRNGILNGPVSYVDSLICSGRLGKAVQRIEPLLRRTVGLTNHSLFMKQHFTGFESVGTFCSEGWCFPISDQGVVVTCSGAMWSTWTWRIHGPRSKWNTESLKYRVEEYLENKFGVELEYRKWSVAEFPNEYDQDFRELNKQQLLPLIESDKVAR